jgi:hypothetical protein
MDFTFTDEQRLMTSAFREFARPVLYSAASRNGGLGMRALALGAGRTFDS